MADDRAGLVHARIATALMFLAYGGILGTWTARIPAVKHGLMLGDGELSIALLGFAAGAITGMQVSGRLIDRFGGARVMVPMALLDAILLILPAYAPTLVALVGALFAFGAVHGTLNIAMNASAVTVERAWAAPIMSSFHAVYSIGGFLGAAAGALLARADVGPGGTFLAVAAAVIAAVALTAPWALAPLSRTSSSAPASSSASSASASSASASSARPASAPSASAPSASASVPSASVPSASARPASAYPSSVGMRGAVLLGLLAFCCLVGEGAAADWASVYLRDTLGSTAALAPAGYAAFAIMMTVGRLAGDSLAASFGPVRLVRGCGTLAAIGLAAGLAIDEPIAGVIGFGCLGAGLSCIAPLIFSAAGRDNPDQPGRAIARVASLGWIGFLVGPIIIGAVAELVGLAWALIIPAALALVVAASASALRPKHPAHPS